MFLRICGLVYDCETTFYADPCRSSREQIVRKRSTPAPHILWSEHSRLDCLQRHLDGEIARQDRRGLSSGKSQGKPSRPVEHPG